MNEQADPGFDDAGEDDLTCPRQGHYRQIGLELPHEAGRTGLAVSPVGPASRGLSNRRVFLLLWPAFFPRGQDIDDEPGPDGDGIVEAHRRVV